MKVLKLIFRNTFRHPLRTGLTILGLAIAVMAFAIIRTTVSSWYTASQAASPNRLITRHAVSLVFTLPIAYEEKISKIEGVTGISHAMWFGGIYVDPKNFFPQFAVDGDTYIDLYPEYIIAPEQMEDFLKQKNAVIIGRRLADRFGWSLGDQVRRYIPGPRKTPMKPSGICAMIISMSACGPRCPVGPDRSVRLLCRLPTLRSRPPSRSKSTPCSRIPRPKP